MKPDIYLAFPDTLLYRSCDVYDFDEVIAKKGVTLQLHYNAVSAWLPNIFPECKL